MTLIEKRREQVVAFWEADWEIDEIAEYLDIPTARVEAIVDTYDLPHDLPQQVEQEMSKGGHVRSQAAAGGDRDFAARLAGKGPRRRPPKPSRAMPHDERWPHPHGTTGGYKRHNREGTPVCGPCLQANRDAQAADRRAAGKPERPYRVKERLA